MLPGGGPLQFLRDTLMGPSDTAEEHHPQHHPQQHPHPQHHPQQHPQHAAATAAAAATGASPKHRPPVTPTTVSEHRRTWRLALLQLLPHSLHLAISRAGEGLFSLGWHLTQTTRISPLPLT